MDATVTNEYRRRAQSLAEDPRTDKDGLDSDQLLRKAQVWATLALAEEFRLLRESQTSARNGDPLPTSDRFQRVSSELDGLLS